MPRSSTPRHQRKRRSATIVGLGAIGSALCEHVARLPDIGRIVVVDPDSFDESNVEGQLITRDAVGRGKAAAVADRLRRIAPDVLVEPEGGTRAGKIDPVLERAVELLRE